MKIIAGKDQCLEPGNIKLMALNFCFRPNKPFEAEFLKT